MSSISSTPKPEQNVVQSNFSGMKTAGKIGLLAVLIMATLLAMMVITYATDLSKMPEVGQIDNAVADNYLYANYGPYANLNIEKYDKAVLDSYRYTNFGPYAGLGAGTYDNAVLRNYRYTNFGPFAEDSK